MSKGSVSAPPSPAEPAALRVKSSASRGPSGARSVRAAVQTVRWERSEQDITIQLEASLRKARQDAARRIRRITTPCLSVGTFLLFFGALLCYLSRTSMGTLPAEFGSLSILIAGLGIVSMLLALVPTRARPIWIVTVGFLVVSAGILVANVVYLGEAVKDPRTQVPALRQTQKEFPAWYVSTFIFLFATWTLGIALLFAGCVRLVWRRPPLRQHLEILWRTMAGTWTCLLLQSCARVIIHAAAGYQDLEEYIWSVGDAAVYAVLALLLAWPGLRVRAQARLAERGSGTSVATAVGALISSRSLKELLPLAKQNFRCVPLDRVTKAMMAASAPDPTLAALSEPAALGQVDAFLSHSWSDDPDAKWEELQAWRAEFRAAMGREPRAWIDKFCIDQGDITNSLAGLPIFLAGCDKLLVLHGRTYQTRLWCLLEIFTFIVMGGSAENLEVRQLRACEVGFDSFDARVATCYSASDKSHLLGIIETGLGTIHAFNGAVREMVGRRCSVSPSPVASVSAACFEAPHTQVDAESDPGGDDEDDDGDLTLDLDRVIVFEDEEMFSF